jgi:hypothetical protein
MITAQDGPCIPDGVACWQQATVVVVVATMVLYHGCMNLEGSSTSMGNLKELQISCSVTAE